MQQPVLLKFQAKQDGSVNKAFSDTKKAAKELTSVFEKSSDESEELAQAIKASVGGQAAKDFKRASDAADKLTSSLKGTSKEAGTVGKGECPFGTSAKCSVGYSTCRGRGPPNSSHRISHP